MKMDEASILQFSCYKVRIFPIFFLVDSSTNFREPVLKILRHVVTAGLLCAATASTFAVEVRVTAPVLDEAGLLQWKKDTLDSYKQVVYLKADNTPMSDAAFFRVIREQSAPFSMTHDTGSRDKLIVRLMTPEEAEAARQKPGPK